MLDFGLAKDWIADAAGPAAEGLSRIAHTHKSSRRHWRGRCAGNVAYMAPEQARGKTVDRRADIWAFGCVLYEMLTGRRAFPGVDVTDTIVSVVSNEPDWLALPALTSPSVRSVLRRCLDKDSKRRLRDIGEARLALQGAFETALPWAAPPARVSKWQRVGLASAWGSVAGGVIAGTLVWFVMRSGPASGVRTALL